MTAGLRIGPALDAAAARDLRRRMVFEWGKWDPQYEDESVLAPFALQLSSQVWTGLCRRAERLFDEAMAAERELLERPELWGHLGLPRSIRSALEQSRWPSRRTLAAPRFARFDFHPTATGWQVSEMNGDVPGGFIESAGLAEVLASHESGTRSAGDPGAVLAEAIASHATTQHPIGLVHATAYTDDRQVMAYLARRLAEFGRRSVLLSPAHVVWGGTGLPPGQPACRCAAYSGPLESILRFYPAEWLPNLESRRLVGRSPHAPWRGFFGPHGRQSNPPSALLTQSKRFPLLFDRLRTRLPTWAEAVPPSCSPSSLLRLGGRWRRPADEAEWVLKPALGRVGEGVAVAGASDTAAMRSARRWASLLPHDWVAQRRFESLPLATPEPLHCCLGVFVVDGVACGAYGRVARRALIDAKARDVAVVVDERHPRSVEARPAFPPARSEEATLVAARPL